MASTSNFVEPHYPTQMYNYAYEYDYAQEEDQMPTHSSAALMSDERAASLIYKNELQQWGGQPEEVPIPEIVDVNVDKKLGPNIRANLLKNLPVNTELPAALGGKTKKEKEKEKPGVTAKRKHQITYLAFMAKQREEALKDQWASNRISRAQTRAKYGF